MLFVAGCTQNDTQTGLIQDSSPKSTIDWVDFIQWEGAMYEKNRQAASLERQWTPGKKLGEVQFMLDEHADAGHMLENGDAAYLPIGTSVYELEGYSPAFRLLADGDIYEVKEPTSAQTIGDFLDIENHVDSIALLSNKDRSELGQLSQTSTKELITELLALPYDSSLRDQNAQTRLFFQIRLKDSTTIRLTYTPESGIINNYAIVSDEMKSLLEREVAAIQEAGREPER